VEGQSAIVAPAQSRLALRNHHGAGGLEAHKTSLERVLTSHAPAPSAARRMSDDPEN